MQAKLIASTNTPIPTTAIVTGLTAADEAGVDASPTKVVVAKELLTTEFAFAVARAVVAVPSADPSAPAPTDAVVSTETWGLVADVDATVVPESPVAATTAAVPVLPSVTEPPEDPVAEGRLAPVEEVTLNPAPVPVLEPLPVSVDDLETSVLD